MIAESPTSIALPTNGQRKWTYDEIAALSDDKRRELHDGVPILMPSPTPRHQELYRALVKFIENWIDAGGQGLLYYQPVDLKVDNYRTLIPDLIYYRTNDRSAIISANGKYLTGVPDLVVEIVSPSSQNTDRFYKFEVYAEIGVRYYWTVDPEYWIFQAFRLVDGEYRFEASLSSEGEFAPELFADLKIPMAQLFGPRPTHSDDDDSIEAV